MDVGSKETYGAVSDTISMVEPVYRWPLQKTLRLRDSSFMPDPNPEKIMTFASPKDLGRWLKENPVSYTHLTLPTIYSV